MDREQGGRVADGVEEDAGRAGNREKGRIVRGGMVGPGEGWVHGRSATIKPHPSMWARGCLVRGARNQIPTFRHSLSDVSVFDVPRQMLIIPLSLFHALVGRMIKARHGNPFLNFRRLS